MGTISSDTFTTSTPAIQYTTADETWTVESGWVVSTSGNDAVNSSVNGSVLINNGNIISGNNLAVNMTGDAASVTNNAGHLIASQSGISFFNSGTITNHGTVLGYTYYGILFSSFSQNVSVANDGDIYGRSAGVYMSQAGIVHTAGGDIDNSGMIRSDHVGISTSLDSGLTMTIENRAGGTITGGDAAIQSASGNISLTNSGTIVGLIDFNGTAANDVVVNSGKIQGVVLLGDGADTFVGSTGTSGKIFGENGADHLTGSTHADQLDGGIGNDILVGGKGKDLLTGGADADHFTFKTAADSAVGAARDMVLDFTRAEGDKIDLAAIDANTHVAGNNAFHFIGTAAFHRVAGELRCSGGIIQADVTGDAVADFEIHVNVATLIANDFVL